MKKRNKFRIKDSKEKGKIQSKSNTIKLFLIPIRYIILLLIVLSISIIYKIFTILTIYPVFGLLKLVLKDVTLFFSQQSNPILLITNTHQIELIPACIAGAAYIFILVLNLTVPMNPKKRVYTIIVSILILLGINILRIFMFSLMYYYSSPYFDFTHELFWYLLSTIFVVGIWFLIVKMYKIKEIPIYSDLKFIYVKYINKIKK